jgi:hypothetical protein
MLMLTVLGQFEVGCVQRLSAAACADVSAFFSQVREVFVLPAMIVDQVLLLHLVLYGTTARTC